MKEVLVTGASRGIGYALALTFLSKGHSVTAIARNQEGLAKLSAEAASLPGILKVKAGDISDFNPTWLQNSSAVIDIIINNAGYLVNRPFSEITPEDLQRSYEVNVFAPYRMLQALLPILAPAAHIINIGSVGGVNGTQKFPGLSAYSSSKAALSCLSECWQAEFADTDWSFNSLALGSVQTEMLAAAFPGYEAQTTVEAMAEYIVDFALHAGKIIKGKTQVVSNSNP